MPESQTKVTPLEPVAQQHVMELTFPVSQTGTCDSLLSANFSH